MIHFSNVQKTFRLGLRRNKKFKALDNISFEVQQNETFGIIGPNGAGKSTLLKILLGLVKADAGTVRIAGCAPGSAHAHHKLGYLPEHPALPLNLTPRELLSFAVRTGEQKRKTLQQDIAQVLERVNLARVINTPLKKFSKGMMQRTALGYALIVNPSILILDEPMSGLDPVGRQLVIDIILDLQAQGTTIIFCSHILTDVERICHRFAILHQGHLLAVATPEELSRVVTTGNTSPLETFFLQKIRES